MGVCIICCGRVPNDLFDNGNSEANIPDSLIFLFSFDIIFANEFTSSHFCLSCLELFGKVFANLNKLRKLENEIKLFKEIILSTLSASQVYFSTGCAVSQDEVNSWVLNYKLCKELNIHESTNDEEQSRLATLQNLDIAIKEENFDEDYQPAQNSPLPLLDLPSPNDSETDDEEFVLSRPSTRSSSQKTSNGLTPEQITYLINKSRNEPAFILIKRIEDLTFEELSQLNSSSYIPKRRKPSDEFKLIGSNSVRSSSMKKKRKNIIGIFPCDSCDYVSKTKGNLRRHRRIIHCVKSKRETCDQCGKTCYKLEKHIKLFHEISEEICDICGAKFKNSRYLTEHQNRVHELKESKCRICGITFKYGKVYEIRAHMEEYHGKAKKSYDCSLCHMKFEFIHKLKRHEFIVHSEVREFPCEICGKIFKEPKNVKAHIKAVHNKEKKHACSICGLKFSSTSHRNRHETVHSTERPHLCDICGKGFKHQAWLSHHKRSDHDGAYNYKKKKSNI